MVASNAAATAATESSGADWAVAMGSLETAGDVVVTASSSVLRAAREVSSPDGDSAVVDSSAAGIGAMGWSSDDEVVVVMILLAARAAVTRVVGRVCVVAIASAVGNGVS